MSKLTLHRSITPGGRLLLAFLTALALLFTIGQAGSKAAGIPGIISVSPSAGSAGTTVMIFGSNLGDVTGVMFGGVPSPQVMNASETSVIAIAPDHPVGQVDVVVSTLFGVSTVNGESKFTYTTGPAIDSISPMSGRPGTTVTISGSGFTNATSVRFGNTAVTPSFFSDSLLTAIAPLFSPGLIVDVTVTTAVGTSPVTANTKFTYLAGPFVTAVTPSIGPPGTLVSIDGAGFNNATSVLFGNIAVAVSVLSDQRVLASAPNGVAGTTVDVQVVTPLGASPLSPNARFTYSGGPIINSITPTSGTAGTLVTITGSGFTNATLVYFGSATAVPTVFSDTTITVLAPANIVSTVNVRVATALGISVETVFAQFTYTGGPVITSLSPSQGVAGVQVTIIGTGFAGTTSVTFGGVNVNFTILSNSQVRVNAPALLSGQVQVRLTTAAGTSAATVASTFTYTNTPVIFSISPNNGQTNTTVTITGAGFTGATSVSFGGTTASPNVINDGQIIVSAPARGAGTVNVVVTSPNGSSPVTGTQTFTYNSASGNTVTYTLNFRWSLIVWLGDDGANIDAALKGQLASSLAESAGGQQIQALTNVYSYVTAVFRWNSVAQKWEASFPGSSNIPGANDFNTFTFERAYWVAITNGPVDWTIPAN